MKNLLFLLLLLLGSNWVQAQTSFIDTNLNDFCRATLERTMKEYDGEICEAAACGLKSDGQLIVNIGLGYQKGRFKTIPTLNSKGIPCGITRGVQFLALMQELRPDFVIDVDGGQHFDSLSNCYIFDENCNYTNITLSKSVDVSNVAIYKAVEYAYKRDINSYAGALFKTGIFFNTTDGGLHANEMWRPCEIMGMRSPISMFQQVAWCSGVLLNQGRILLRFSDSDSPEPVCKVKSSKRAIEELRKAMVLAVDSGSAYLLRTPGLSVGALLNVSEPDVVQCHAVTGFICLQGMNGTGYTIGFYVLKHGQARREMVTSILRKVIDYMVTHGYMINANVTVNVDSMRPRYHAAEKGR